jgi:hypothetical protein
MNDDKVLENALGLIYQKGHYKGVVDTISLLEELSNRLDSIDEDDVVKFIVIARQQLEVHPYKLSQDDHLSNP